MIKYWKKILAKVADATFIVLWSLFYYVLFRYYILKILWFGTLPMDYIHYDIHLLFLWMVACAIGFGFWLKANGREYFVSSLGDKGGLLIVSLILILVFFLGVGLVSLISGWMGDYQQSSAFWSRAVLHLQRQYL